MDNKRVATLKGVAAALKSRASRIKIMTDENIRDRELIGLMTDSQSGLMVIFGLEKMSDAAYIHKNIVTERIGVDQTGAATYEQLEPTDPNNPEDPGDPNNIGDVCFVPKQVAAGEGVEGRLYALVFARNDILVQLKSNAETVEDWAVLQEIAGVIDEKLKKASVDR